jgi:hypothetical protein
MSYAEEDACHMRRLYSIEEEEVDLLQANPVHKLDTRGGGFIRAQEEVSSRSRSRRRTSMYSVKRALVYRQKRPSM